MKKLIVFIIFLFSLILFTFPMGQQVVASISNPSDWIAISNYTDLCELKNAPTSNYYLTNDIDCEYQMWESIYNFSGMLEGNGYSIKNLNLCNPFVNINYGEIINVNITDLNFGYPDDIYYQIKSIVSRYNYGLIDNVHLEGNFSNILWLDFGGIAYENHGTISNSNVNIFVENGLNKYVHDTVRFGAIASTNCRDGLICDSKVTGEFILNDDITISDSVLYVGGVCGYNSGRIIDCESELDIKMKLDIYYGYYGNEYSYIGGIVGYSETELHSLFYSGDIDIDTYNCSGYLYYYVGGIAGSCINVRNCYTNGYIHGTRHSLIGGIVGSGSSVSICVSNMEVIGHADYRYGDIDYGPIAYYCFYINNCLFTGDSPNNSKLTGYQIHNNNTENKYMNYNIDCRNISDFENEDLSMYDEYDRDIWNFDILGSNKYPQLNILYFNFNTNDGYGKIIFDYYNATLDGNEYKSGEAITEVGYHTFTLSVSDYSYTEEILILPEISDIEEGKSYSGSVTPNIQGGTITLDGKSYDGVSTITEPGTHVIKIEGVNGYEKELNFTIDLETSGINSNDELIMKGSLIFSGGTAKLDGQPYISSQEITEVGNHTIVIAGSNEYTKTITFTILPEINEVENEKIYSGSVTPNIQGGTITLNGKLYDGISTITEPGTHVIKIEGVNGYEKELNFTIDLETSGINNNDELIMKGSLIFSGGTAKLDGQPYISSQEITEVGNHTIVIAGSNEYTKTITFTILPEINEVENEKIYSGSVTPNIQGGTITLNGKLYDGVSTIKEVGYHTILITGSNEYSKTINFTVLPNVSGIESGKTYSGSVTPNIQGGTITLDGKSYDGVSTITEPGTHVIKIEGVNGYEKELNFTIDLETSGINSNDELIMKGSLIFSGGTAKLDGQPYISSQEITEVGNHTIVIAGSNEYTKTITFTILPEINEVENEKIYSGSVTPNIQGGTITLNGKLYDGISTITEPGTHVIKIEGVNGYEQIISFVIELVSSAIEDGCSYFGSAYYDFSGGTARLDGQSYSSGEIITEVGNHTIVITGSNEYNKTISFTILPRVSGIEENKTYVGSVTPNIIGGSITLDGKPYNGVSKITEPGIHVIKITGVNSYEQLITFIIDLTTSGVDNNDEYYGSISCIFSGGIATLDEQPYTTGKDISEIGYHTIVITGSNGYSKTIKFTILPKISGIKNGQTYTGSVTPNIQGGTITLNGKLYDGISTIIEPGTHVIKITGTNGYQQEITFEISLVTSGIENNFVYLNNVSLIFSGGIASLDGKSYVSGQSISEVGDHRVVITGSNGYNKTIKFTIKAVDYNILSGDNSWEILINAKHPQTTITIDGKYVTDSYVETYIGNHTLVIKNGDYEEIIEFIVKENLSFKDGDIFTNPIVIGNIKGDVYIDGDLVESGYRIDKHGTHEIKIVGTNGYESSLQIQYINPNYHNAFIMVIPLVLIIVGIAYLVIRRRRVI